MTSVEKHLPGLHDQKDHGRRSLSRLAGLGSLARTISPKRTGGRFTIPTEPIDAGYRQIEEYDGREFWYGDNRWESSDTPDVDEDWYGSYQDWVSWPGNWAMRMASASVMGQTLPAAIGDEYIDDDVRESLITGKVPEFGSSEDDVHRYVEEAVAGLRKVYYSTRGGSSGSYMRAYRGISVDRDDDVLKLTPGDEFIMPLSAFSPNHLDAATFADQGDFGGDVSVLFKIPAGTAVAASVNYDGGGFYNEDEVWVDEAPAEFVTAGRFSVESIEWKSHDKVWITLRQQATFSPDSVGWEDVSKADLGMPEWVWKLSGSFTSEISKRRSYVPPHWRDGKPVKGYYREIGNKGAHKVIQWDIPDLTQSEATLRLREALPNLMYQRSHRIPAPTDAEPGVAYYATEKVVQADITGLDRLTARERGTLVTSIESMAKKYPQTASNVVSLRIYNRSDPLAYMDGVSFRTAAGSTSVGHHFGTPPPNAVVVGGRMSTQDYGIVLSFDIDQHAIAAAQFHAETFDRDKIDAKDIATLRWVDPNEDVNDTVQEWLAESIVHEFTHARHFSLIHDVFAEEYQHKFAAGTDWWYQMDHGNSLAHGPLGDALSGVYVDNDGRLPTVVDTTDAPSLYGKNGGVAETLAEMGVAQEMGIGRWSHLDDETMLAKAEHSVLCEGVAGWGIYDTMADFLGVDEIAKADLTPEFNGDVLDSLGEFADATRITGKMSRAQREAVRVQMRRAMARGEDLTKATARIKRLHLGLSPRDSLALDNYREALRKQGIPEARVERQVRAYSKRLQAKRNQLIASQEIAIAYGDAKRAEWTKAQDAGVLSDKAMRVYHTHPDERTCEVCRPLDGTKRKLDDPVAPPMHVSCRCWETIEDPGAKTGMLKQAKVKRPYRGNQHRRVTELVLTDKARALLASLDNDTEGITNWGALAPTPIFKKKVVVPPYIRADGTKVEGYTYERKSKKPRRWSRSRRPVDRRVRDYTGKPDDWVQPEEFSWTRANIDLGTGTSPLPRDRAAIKRKVNKDLTKSLMIRSETDAVLHDSLDLLAEGLMITDAFGDERQRYGNDDEQNRYEVSKKIVRAVIDGWANSSWKAAESTAFQKAVARRFDAPGIKAVTEVRDGLSDHVVGDARNRKLGWNKESDSAITAEILDNVQLLHDGTTEGANKRTVMAMDAVMDALVDAVYENTQKVLDDQKVEELHLHRGTSAQYVDQPMADKTVKLEGEDYGKFVDLVELATDSFLIAQDAYNLHTNKQREIEFYLWTNDGDGRRSSDEQEKFMGPLAHENIKLITNVDIPLDDRRVLTIGVPHWWVSDMLASSYYPAGDMRITAWKLIDRPALVNNEDTFDVQARDVNMFVKAMIPRVEPNAGNLAERDRFRGKDMTAGQKMYQMFTGRDEPYEGAPGTNWGLTLMDDDNLAATIAFEYTQNAPGVRDYIDKLWADMHTTLVETVGEEGMAELRKLREMEIDEELLRNNAGVKHLISQDTDDTVISEIRKLLGADISGNNVDDILTSIRNGTAGTIPGGGEYAVEYLRDSKTVEFTVPGATSLGAVLQPASAFSTTYDVAKRFGSMMLSAVVPKERILSTAMTGPGCLNEDEMLVIGGETDLSVTAPVHGYGTAKMVVKADPRIWPDLDEADWLKEIGDDITDYDL